MSAELANPETQAGTSGGVRFVRLAFFYLASALALCVIAQVFIAGLAVFVNPLNWVRHINFVHYFEGLPPLLLILSFFGRLPTKLRWQSAGLIGLIFIQYFTANVRDVLPWASAAHPVTAMLLFWLALQIAATARGLAFKR